MNENLGIYQKKLQESQAFLRPRPRYSKKLTLHDLLQILSKENSENVLPRLRSAILEASSLILDEENEDGKCVLEELLERFWDFKDLDEPDVLEIVLIKSRIRYEQRVLDMLRKFDERKPCTVKVLQWMILTGKVDELTTELTTLGTIDGNCLTHLYRSAFIVGSLEVLKILLKHPLDLHDLACPLLITAAKSRQFVKQRNLKIYHHCFQYVLNNKDIDVNDVDLEGNTVLHIAQDQILVKMILQQKPLTGVKNLAGQYALSNIDEGTIHDFLDYLVSKNPPENSIMYSSSDQKVSPIELEFLPKAKLHNNLLYLDLTAFHVPSENPSLYALDAIIAIANSKKHMSLANHALIKVIYELYCAKYNRRIIWDRPAMIGFVVIYLWLWTNKFERTDLNDSFHQGLFVLMMFLLAIMLIYMVFYYGFVIFVFKISKRRSDFASSYRLKTLFFTDLPLLCMICMLLCHKFLPFDLNQVLGVGIILLSIKFTLSLGFTNRLTGVNIVMLGSVIANAVKFLVSTFPIILGFALGLMHLLNHYSLHRNESNLIDHKNLTAKETFSYSKSDIWMSILKTFIMMTGELDANNLDFRYFMSYPAFVCFVFLIPIVFINLLNGLAIGDIQIIQQQAEFWYRRSQLMVIYQFSCLSMAFR